MPALEPLTVRSLATASPPFEMAQATAGRFLEGRYGGSLSGQGAAVLRKAFAHPSVQRRRFALSAAEALVNEDPDARVERFTRWAVALAAQAAGQALERAGLRPGDVSGLVVNTCTGYLCPGLSTYLIERLGLAASVRAYDLVGSGCSGAVANLQLAEQVQRGAARGVTLSVAVEVCSATFQMGNDPGLIVSNALFADGAAAAVVAPKPGLVDLVDSACRFDPAHREEIRYVHRQGQLHNQLSRRLPQTLRGPVGALVRELLGRRGLAPADVPHWALHAGGDRILRALQEEFALSEAQLRPARTVLAEQGNLSSPTVWFVLREVLRARPAPGDWCLLLAFGAGLSVHGFLLRIASGDRGRA